MLNSPATMIGMAGVIFLAGGFAPASFGIASLAQSDSPLARPILKAATAQAKGDRMAEPLPAAQRATISTVELVGVTQATVILRDRNGEILYRSDPRSGVTIFTKDADLPIITLKEEIRAPVVQHPAANRREGTEVPADQKPKRRNPVGCLGDVSPLARAAADRTPSLCLALVDQSLS
jgi:hypothetical protein